VGVRARPTSAAATTSASIGKVISKPINVASVRTALTR
jgi:hypothetical protein